MKRITVWLNDFEYDGQMFSIEYDKRGGIENIFLVVGGGFICDLLNVNEFVSDHFRELCLGKLPERDDTDKIYESARDMGLENDDGGSAA